MVERTPPRVTPEHFRKRLRLGKRNVADIVRPVPLRPCLQNPQKLLLCHPHLPSNYQCLSYPNLLLFLINVWPILPVPLRPLLTGTHDGSKDAQPVMLSQSSTASKFTSKSHLSPKPTMVKPDPPVEPTDSIDQKTKHV